MIIIRVWVILKAVVNLYFIWGFFVNEMNQVKGDVLRCQFQAYNLP